MKNEIKNITEDQEKETQADHFEKELYRLILNDPKILEDPKIEIDRLEHAKRYVGEGGWMRHIEDQIRGMVAMKVPEERILKKINEWANDRRPDIIQDDLSHLKELMNSRWNRFELKFSKNRPGDFGANFRLSFAGVYAVYHFSEIIYFGTAVDLRQRFIQHVFPISPMVETPLYKYLEGNFEGIEIEVKKMDREFMRLTLEGRVIHRLKPIVNTHYKKRES